jgi:hypothetical protein
MVEGAEVWRQLLRVEEPWSVLGFTIDPVCRNHEVIVGLGTAKGWFSGAPKAAAPGFERLWRHVNFGDWDVTVRVIAPTGANLSGLPWAGQGGLPFTNLLSQEIFALLRHGLSTQAIAEHLRLPHDDLWRFRHAIDAGHWLPPLEQGTDTDEALPSIANPVWLGLLDGTRELDVRLLSLKLMLTKLRSQLAANPGEAARVLTVQELYGFFVRNKRSLEHEIAQLREGA